MRGLRRAALAIGIAALFAAALRLRGSSGAPAQEGGWRELGEDELGGSGPLGPSQGSSGTGAEPVGA